MSTSNETSAPTASTSALPEPTVQQNAVVIKAPNPFTDAPRPRVFLAGSIEMGTAEDWQTRLSDRLAQIYKTDKARVVTFGFRTAFGGGRSTGFGLIYDDEASQKKFEPKYRLIRVRVPPFCIIKFY